jgi:hypothetical protein
MGEIVFHSMRKLEAILCSVILYEEMGEYIIMYYFEHVNLRCSVYLGPGSRSSHWHRLSVVRLGLLLKGSILLLLMLLLQGSVLLLLMLLLQGSVLLLLMLLLQGSILLLLMLLLQGSVLLLLMLLLQGSVLLLLMLLLQGSVLRLGRG